MSLPYTVPISRFIDHFEINIDDEVKDSTGSRKSCENTKKHLEKLGMKNVRRQWVMIGEGPTLDKDEMEEVADLAAQEHVT